jgi:hypothetical protein
VVIDNPGTPGSKAFMKLAQEFLEKVWVLVIWATVLDPGHEILH